VDGGGGAELGAKRDARIERYWGSMFVFVQRLPKQMFLNAFWAPIVADAIAMLAFSQAVMSCFCCC